nr:Unknown Function [uncultured bacterium]
MKQVRYSLLLIFSVATLVGGLFTLPVYAHQGADDAIEGHVESLTDDSRSTSSGSGSGSSGTNTLRSVTSTKTEVEQEVERANDDTPHSSLEDRTRTLLTDRRKGKEVRSTADLQAVCRSRQEGIVKRSANLNDNAQKHLVRYDALFSKLKDYQNTTGAKPDNYDALVADITAKQAAATAAVSTLKEATATVDCAAADPAATVAEVKTSAEDAKSALKEYKASLRALVKAQLAAQGSN